MDPVRYSRNLATGLTGQRYDSSLMDSFTYKQPTNTQDIDVEITTGEAGTWHAKITDLTEGFDTQFDFTGDAAAATVAANLIAAWNNTGGGGTPANQFKHWSTVTTGGGAIIDFRFVVPNRRYDIVLTPPSATGVYTVTDVTATQLLAEVGVAAFVDQTATTKTASRVLVAASAAGITGFRGVIERTDFLTQDGPPGQTYDYYRSGKTVPVVRRGRMWVHVADVVTPVSAVAVVTTAGLHRLGTFGTTGASRTALTAARARYLSEAAAGERAQLEVYGIY